jgi:hypothetical protein
MWSMLTTSEFDAWYDGLTQEEQSEVLARLALLRAMGPHLGRPHVDTIKAQRSPTSRSCEHIPAVRY